jgi:type II secretion system protein N
MTRWLLMSAGSLLWGSLVYSVGVAVSFPGDMLAKRIAYEVQEKSKKEFLVNIADASFAGIGGIGLEDVTLYKSKRGRRSPGEKTTPGRENTELFSVSQIDIRPRLRSLLTGTLMADYGLSIPSGDIEGAFGFDSSKLYIESDTEGIDLSKLPIDLEDGSLDLSGKLSLLADLALDQQEVKQSTGSLSLSVDGLTLNSGTISGFTLSETTFSEAVLEMQVADGKATVTKGNFIGDLLEMTVDGYIALNKSLGRSRLNLKIQIRFDDTLDKFAQIAFKRSRDEDGVYHFRGSGTVTNPRFRADRTHASRSSRANDNDGNGGSILDQNLNDDQGAKSRPRKVSTVSDEEREERREKRRDRLKKRRERMKQRREDRRVETQAGSNNDDFQNGNSQEYDDEELLDDQAEEFERVQNFEDDMPQDDYEDYENTNGNNNLEEIGYLDE